MEHPKVDHPLVKDQKIPTKVRKPKVGILSRIGETKAVDVEKTANGPK